MILSANIHHKTIGRKKLFNDLNISIQDGEKVGLIGRNGVGKTSLFRMLSGEDKDFDGEVKIKKGAHILMTAQEHNKVAEDLTVLEYILSSLPDYLALHKIIEEYPKHMGNDISKINIYSEALDKFTQKEYFFAEQRVVEALENYQIPAEVVRRTLSSLSGGQKRFVELVKVQESGANIALIDEPTNHMDYVAKDSFIKWMRNADTTLIIVTHDRDVLKYVDRIIEIKDGKAENYKGNYSAYLKINSTRTVTGMAQYEVGQRTIEKLKKQIAYARSKKAMWGGTADKKNPFVVMEERALRELAELQKIDKPSFWIDQDSADQLSYKMVEKYHKYKDKNIRLSGIDSEHKKQELVSVENLVLGYQKPLFKPVSFKLYAGERVRLHGRNGAGKTTIVKYLLSNYEASKTDIERFDGEVSLNRKLNIGLYQQEIDSRYLSFTLADAVEDVYRLKGKTVTEKEIRQIIASYLFDANRDFSQIIDTLSGGQKARFQLIAMLAAEPNLLILDEPTNHLDLPSIEELENALVKYQGAVLYISHDSYFVDKMAGTEVVVAE